MGRAVARLSLRYAVRCLRHERGGLAWGLNDTNTSLTPVPS
jgi:hypothetical protein